MFTMQKNGDLMMASKCQWRWKMLQRWKPTTLCRVVSTLPSCETKMIKNGDDKHDKDDDDKNDKDDKDEDENHNKDDKDEKD